jgi:hypothetical protein
MIDLTLPDAPCLAEHGYGGTLRIRPINPMPREAVAERQQVCGGEATEP